MKRIARHGYKIYIRIPGGEIQYGRLTGRVVVWFCRRRYIVVPAWKAVG